MKVLCKLYLKELEVYKRLPQLYNCCGRLAFYIFNQYLKFFISLHPAETQRSDNMFARTKLWVKKKNRAPQRSIQKSITLTIFFFIFLPFQNRFFFSLWCFIIHCKNDLTFKNIFSLPHANHMKYWGVLLNKSQPHLHGPGDVGNNPHSWCSAD